jgi:hypothetical protein
MKKKESAGKRIWNNRVQILEGIKNRVFQTEAVEDIAAMRMEICKPCPEYDTEGKDCTVPGTQPCCRLCGCSLAFKTRSMSSSCPSFLWDKVLNDEEDIEHDELSPNEDA